MRLTELWIRLDAALGQGYSRSWAHDFHIDLLDGKTVMQALDAGYDHQEIWRAVHRTLALPERDR